MIKVTRKNLQPIKRRNIRNTDGVIALWLVFIQEYCMNIQVIFRLSAVQQRTFFIFLKESYYWIRHFSEPQGHHGVMTVANTFDISNSVIKVSEG